MAQITNHYALDGPWPLTFPVQALFRFDQSQDGLRVTKTEWMILLCHGSLDRVVVRCEGDPTTFRQDKEALVHAIKDLEVPNNAICALPFLSSTPMVEKR